ncbi:rare lipoprotein A [Herbaspirillum sp. Sphag1AN]|uniref:septal ring lytic transglycosylase RlpA family protein n=1 Tax=unclassified Herbaspirillum TaxID=2624150 RepID=UPI00161DE7F6|nr:MULTISPECIES: septal ring lytic transglycosylase RlpA family protein [unclassified Herbaspirillum]MBB3213588.1 rare lipoprotein A [Herbaspirillum sp. Sphag1AN]MBB3246786.1 rare lipoprotein A [Herbaspirillum sp. Sphag64]
MRAHLDVFPRLLRGLSVLIPLALAACSSAPPRTDTVAPATAVRSTPSKPLPALPPAGSGRGGYYKDDGPGDNPPDGLLNTPDADPKIEPYLKSASRPYVVFGKTYVPIVDDRPYKERGIGSWYGKKFHGAKTSSGELYDMYKMTAAHPTLPIPSYARVTNLKTGAQVIVRINDRGPFHTTRIIDLSYTAALKLGYLSSGSSELEVERLLPDEIRRMAENKRNGISSTVVAGATGMPATSGAADPAVSVGAVAPPGQLAQAEMPALAQPQAITTGSNVSAASAAATSSVATATGTTAAAVAPGIYLQLGAFSQEANARAARDKLMASLNGAVASLDTVVVNGMYRVVAGPYASRPVAQSTAQLIRQRIDVTPFIIER